MKNKIDRILDLARWAPSGDNQQPWRFEYPKSDTVIINRELTNNVYDLDGVSAALALGALLENISLAATTEALNVEILIAPDDVVLVFTEGSGAPDSLSFDIRYRMTNRGNYDATPLAKGMKAYLRKSLPAGYDVVFYEDSAKNEIAKHIFKLAYARLTTKEAYDTHMQAIDWDAKYSKTGIPGHALGMGPISLKLAKWSMKSWRRVQFLNRFAFGSILPRVMLDYLPARNCGAQFIIIRGDLQQNHIESGRALQRFWLTAAQMGMQLQPEMTPLIFTRYVKDDIQFTTNKRALKKTKKRVAEFREYIGNSVIDRAVFMGRIGYGDPPDSRSIRRDL